MSRLQRSLLLAVLITVTLTGLLAAMPGDIDGDTDVDVDDINLILAALGSTVGPGDPRDLDADGTITVLDARKAAAMCTRGDACSIGNNAPAIADQTFSVDENSPNGTAVGTAAASDPDGDPITFAITLGNTNGAFAIDSNSGEITVANVAELDFETTTQFTLTVEVTDPSSATDSATITIDVNDVVENLAPVISTGNTVSVAENQTTVVDVDATDPDGDTEGAGLNYSLTGGADQALFSIVSATGVLTFDVAPDFEAPTDANTDNVYEVQITVTDSGGPPVLTDALDLMVTVTGVDEPPVAVDDAATVTEDDPATAIDVLFNDTDVDAGPISVVSVTQPANGAVVITGGGTGLTYQPDANYCNGGAPTDDFTYTLTPGTSSATVRVTVTCVDDPPLAMDDMATVLEDAPPTTINVLLNDGDIDGGPISVTSVTQPANGTSAVAGGGANVTYEPDPNFCTDPPGTMTDDFMYTVSPGGTTATVAVTVGCVDDTPVVDLDGTVDDPGGDIDYATSFTEGGSPISVGDMANLTVSDPDSVNLESAKVTIMNPVDYDLGGSTTEEILAIDPLTVSPNTPIVVDAVKNGSTPIDNSPSPVTVELLLSGTATLAQYQAALRSVTYQNASADPTESPVRMIEVIVDDANLLSSRTPLAPPDLLAIDSPIISPTATSSITVIAVNDVPTLGGGPFMAAFTEDGGPVAVTSTITVADLDDANLQSATVTITNLTDAGDEVLAAAASGAIGAGDISFVAPTLTIAPAGGAPLADFEAVLQSVTYENTSDDPTEAPDRSLSIVVNDGADPSAAATSTVTVAAVNDAPTATNLTQTKTYTEGDATVALDDIVVSDVDTSPAQTITATLTLADTATGVLTAGSGNGETYTAGTGVWTITGTLAQVNAALAAVSFTPATNNDVDTTIATHVEDQDAAGPADGTITLDVTPVNEAPTATNLTQNKTYTEGDASVALDDIVVSDVDTVPAQTITATLTLADTATGVLTAGSGNGETYTPGTGVWTITGTLAQVNAALAAVSFTPATNNDVDTTIATHVEDQDTVGPADGTITLDVTPVNDAPTATNLTQTKGYTEGDASVALDDIVVSDVDTDPAQAITATLTLADTATGVLTAGSGNGETYTPGTGVWTITGTLAQVNAALAAVSFTPATDNDVDTTIATHVEDQDAAGPADGTITLDVTPVNDAPSLSTPHMAAFVEAAGAVAIAPTITVTDVDNANLASATVTLTNAQDGADEKLDSTACGGLTVGGAGTATLSISGAGTVASYQTCLQSVTYENTDLTPTETPARSITLVVNDGALPSNTATSTVTVTGVPNPPVAVDDAYTAVGNVELVTGGVTPTSLARVTDADGVLTKGTDDSDPVEMTAISVIGINGTMSLTGMSTLGGDVTMNANGTFVYVPPVGMKNKTGAMADTFTYTIQNGVGAQATGTVSIEIVDALVWFVHNDPTGEPLNAAGGDGRSNDPFDTLAAADSFLAGPSGVGDTIFVFEGDGTTAGQNLGIRLGPGQKLIGHETATHTFGGVVVGIPNPPTAPNKPMIENTAGDAVSVLAALADQVGVEVRGLWIAGTVNAIDVTSLVATSHAVGITIADNFINSSGAEAIDLNPESMGNFAATITNNSFATSSPTGNAIDIVQGVNAGQVEVAINGNTDITSSGGSGINLDGSAAGSGTLFVTGFSGNSVHGNTAGAGVNIRGAIFDADPSDPDFDLVSAGTTTVGSSGNPVGTAGMVLGNPAAAANRVSGNLSFAQLDIFNSNGTGLAVAGSAVASGGAPPTAGFQLATTTGTIVATGGPAIDFDPLTAATTFGQVVSTTSATTGISLVDVAGTITINDSGGGSAVTGAANTSFSISGGTANVTYTGDITHAAAGFAAVSVTGGHTTGTIGFGGTINATNGTGLQFDNADGTYNFNTMTGTTTLAGGDAGIDILNGSAGTFTFGNTTITDPSGDSFALANSNADVTYSGSISDTDDFAVSIDNHDAGAITFQAGTITSSGAAATGIRVLNSGGGSSVTFNGAVTLNTAANDAATFTANAGSTVSFNGGLNIDTTSGRGLNASDGGTLNVAATGGDESINTTAGEAIQIDNLALGITFDSVTSANSASEGIQLDNISGTLTINGGSITGASGTAYDVGGAANGSGGNATVIYAGSITNTASRAVLIQELSGGSHTLSGNITHGTTGTPVSAIGIQVSEINNGTAGTVTFSGSTKSINTTGANNGIELNTNPNGTINFSNGGLAIQTTSGAGFNATAGASAINVTGAGNTVTSTTGTAVNINSSTIGASDVTFESISSTGVGANPGIVLNSTGTTGGLTVTGNGGTCTVATPTCTGGRITGKTGNGISLTTTQDVSLTRMRIDSNLDSGINGTSVTNFSLIDSLVDDNANNTVGIEAGLSFTNLLGNAAITNSVVRRSTENNIEIQQTSGTLTLLNITGSRIEDTDAGTGADGMLFEATGGTHTISVGTSTFEDNLSDGIQVVSRSTATVTFTATGTTFRNGARALNLSNADSADLTFTVSANTIDGFTALDEAINVAAASTTTGAAVLRGSVSNHTSNLNIPGGFLGVDTRGNGQVIMSITGNTVVSERQPIDIITGDAVGDAGDNHFTITGNNVTATGNGGAPNNEGIFLEMLRLTTTCMNIRNNTATGSGSREGIELIEDLDAVPGNARLESGPADCTTGCADAETHLDTENTSTAFVDEFNLGVMLVAPGTCMTP